MSKWLEEYLKLTEMRKQKQHINDGIMEAHERPTKWLEEKRALEAEQAAQKESGLDFFDGGAFDDDKGNFFTDLADTIGGTVTDIIMTPVKGALRLGEGIVDLGMYAVGGAADLLGADGFAEGVKDIAKFEAIEGLYDGIGITNITDNSVFGRTTQGILEGVGQVGGLIATGGLANAAGVSGTALTTGSMFASSAGSGMSEAYNDGATDEDALKYGLLKGGIDAGTELMFGGMGRGINAVGFNKGLLGVDDMLATAAGKAFTSKVGKTVAQMGIKATAEGVEELAAGYLTAHAKKGTFQSEEDFDKILEDENLLEQFIVGTATGGIMQTGSISSSMSGRDIVTGLTENEQMVLDKEIEDRIAEAEKDGNELTNKDKKKIREDARKDLERGYINVDTIERALSPQTYDRYQKAVDSESKLEEEIKKLEDMPNAEITVKQAERLTEARKELEQLRQKDEKTTLKNMLSEEVRTATEKDNYLVESYNEKAKRGKVYEADVSKYSEAERKTIQKAIDSKVLNNSNKTHAFVDLMAKISADKGIDIDFANNKKLQESGFAIEGKTINGYVHNGNITLNISSPKAMEMVVGHEITHILEGTDMYAELQEAVKLYAETKGDYDTRLEEIQNLYKDVKNANIENELTADLVGEYLFTDESFINSLSTEKPNIFKRIYNEIKYFINQVILGSKEAKQLEKVKRMFDKAYKENVELQGTSDAKYSLTGVDEEGIEVYETSDEVKKLSYSERNKLLLKSVLEDYKGRTAKFYKNGQAYYAQYNEQGVRKGVYGDKKSDMNGRKAKTNIGADGNYVELAENALYTGTLTEKGKITNNGFHTDAKTWDYYEKTIKSDGKYFDVLINVKDTGNEQYVYDITLKEASPPHRTNLSSRGELVSDVIITPLEQNASGNTQFSLTEVPLNKRLKGDALLDAEDLIIELEGKADISPNGYVTLYHRTTPVNANKIKETGKMSAKEDGIFFSTRKDGYNEGYGDTAIEFRIPVEKLVLDDIFDDEAHLKIPLRNRNQTLDVSSYLVGNNMQYSLSTDSKGNQLSRNPNLTYGSDIGYDPSTETLWPINDGYDMGPVREGVEEFDTAEPLAMSQETENANAESTTSVSHKAIQAQYVENVKQRYSEEGYDFDKILENAKDLSTFSTVDNTPQRVVEKAFGYEEGKIFNEMTIEQTAENESRAVRWLNLYTDRKSGELAKLSKKYGIKPHSKEDAAAQMYGEGFWVNEAGEYVKYGDLELSKDFPDIQIQNRIKGLATDPRVREIYDETLQMINESRVRNGYDEIPKRDNYFLHFMTNEDVLSKWGLPFNPNDIRAMDLPTELNGVTADLKPGKPYFGSENRRMGNRTTYSLLGGMERYLNSAKGQIFHIDDIQLYRGLRNYIAEMFGRSQGLENLDQLDEDAQEARIKEVFSSHLSTFAKFLNEQANVVAGKTALIDRGIEGILGRRGMTTLSTINKQVATNMVGFNISSSLTNLLSGIQAASYCNKFDVIKGFTQTVSNKIKGIWGKSDGFAEANDAMVRRKGVEKFYRTPWEKVTDAGFAMMGAIDNVSTEFIVRIKYNELTRKGMDSEQAHKEAGKWAMKVLGDRSLGQMPHIFNSKTLGIITKFQLEVRNQLDSMWYDRVQETKSQYKDIENKFERNSKIAAKITSTVVQLAVFSHLFGTAFESVAGYNPAFDIIDTLIKLFGFDDEEDSEDTVLDNVDQAFQALLEDLPYTSAFTGGRVPISSALPISDFLTGTDEYGNEKPRWETIAGALPYYVMPTGYNQGKKMLQGLSMYNEDLPVPGSYTDSGNLRFAVDDSPLDIIQAAVFGQWANENAQDYIDNERQTLKSKQIEEFAELHDLGMTQKEYWDYREGLKDKDGLEDKFEYIADLNIPVQQKNIMINNAVERNDPIDLSNYDDFSEFEEFDFYSKNPEKWTVSKAIGTYKDYRTYTNALKAITADKDAKGNSVASSRREKVLEYINGIKASYETKIMLYKMEYPSDDTYNMEIINYLNNRQDISRKEMETILNELGFNVGPDGTITW